jgi:acetyltransferase EpsM
MKSIVIYGAGGHALVVADAVRSSGDKVVGFLDDISPERKGSSIHGIPILGGYEELLQLTWRQNVEVALGFGHCHARKKLILELKKQGIKPATVIHPDSTVSPSAYINQGAYIGPRVTIEADCRIGVATIINCGSEVCHETKIGDYSAICPGVHIGGQSGIGKRVWVGIGSTIIDKIQVGDGCYIGAGSVVVDHLPSNKKCYGVPARIIQRMTDNF